MRKLSHHAAGWFAALLLGFGWTVPGYATPPSTPISVDLKLSDAPRLNEWAAVTITVKSIRNAPNTRVELVLPEGVAASNRRWTLDLRANSPVTLRSSISSRTAGNITVSARAVRRESRSEIWGDMESIPLTVGSAASGASKRGWTVDNVPVATLGKAGNARIVSSEPTPFSFAEEAARASSRSALPSVDPSREPGKPAAASSARRRAITLTGIWRYIDRAGASRPIDQQVVEIRRGDGSALSPQVFCFTDSNGAYSCPLPHPGTTVRAWVRSWTLFNRPGGTDRLGVFDGPEVPGGCASDAVNCSYPVQTPAISCADGTSCDLGTWFVDNSVPEPHLGAHRMEQDLIQSWKKLFFSSPHGAATSGPARIDYPAPNGHGTHAHVPPADGWISIEPPNQNSASVVTHEYGHVVMANVYNGRTPNWPTSDCPSPHFIGAAGGPGCALSEGFGNFWMWYSTGDPVFRFAGGGTNDLETRDGGTFASGDTVEGNVAAAMGDMFDFANDGPANGLRDRLSDGIGHVWHAISLQSDNNFAEWWNAYIAFGHSVCPALEILRFNTINYTHGSCPSFTVAVSASPSGGGTATGGGTYINGTSITVSALANSGFSFVNWTEGGSQASTSPNFNFTVGGNRTLVANFAQPLPPAVVSNLIAPSGQIVDRTPTFRWGPAARATSYFLQVRNNAGNVVFGQLFNASTLRCGNGVRNCRFTLPGAEQLALGRHKWRVRAQNAAGNAAFSAYKNFRVANPLGLAAVD